MRGAYTPSANLDMYLYIPPRNGE